MTRTKPAQSPDESPGTSVAATDGHPALAHLMQIALDALRMTPPDYIRSIFGPPATWLPPFRRFSEYGILNLWRPLRMAKFLQHTWLPSFPRTPPTFTSGSVRSRLMPRTVMLAAPPSAAVMLRVTACPAPSAVSRTGAGHGVVSGEPCGVQVKVTVTGVRYQP